MLDARVEAVIIDRANKERKLVEFACCKLFLSQVRSGRDSGFNRRLRAIKELKLGCT